MKNLNLRKRIRALVDYIIQEEYCKRYNTTFYASSPIQKIGISLNVRDGVLPINGLRHPPEADTSGWYIWAGEELSNDSDFFKPLHIEHLKDWCPEVIKFLGLPPGWRFLLSDDYEDVWHDKNLINL